MSDINFCNTKEQLNHFGEVVTGKTNGSPSGSDISTSILPYTGQVRKTLPTLEAEYLSAIQSAGGDALNNGVWSAGQTFTAYNQYMAYNGVPYKPKSTTSLPYGPTVAAPDFSFVQPYVEISAGEVSNTNLTVNSNFEVAGSVSNAPDATPRNYTAGDELFKGFTAIGALSGVTYVNGVLNGTGELYCDVVKSETMQLSTSGVIASVAGSNGKPITAGITVADNGLSYRVTFDISGVFSVKLEQGSVATRHDVKSRSLVSGLTNLQVSTVNDLKSTDWSQYVGDSVSWTSYHNAAIPLKSAGGGVGYVVKAGTFTADDFTVFDCINSQIVQMFTSDPTVAQAGAFADDVNDDSPAFLRAINAFPHSSICMQNLNYTCKSQIPIPNSASFYLYGSDGVQSSFQNRISCVFNGKLFYSPVGDTVFCSFGSVRFVSNKLAYPLAQAISLEGDTVHMSWDKVTVQNFKQIPIFIQLANLCKFDKILGMFNDDYFIKVASGISCEFLGLTGDNQDGGGADIAGSSHTINANFEDCCKRNDPSVDNLSFYDLQLRGGGHNVTLVLNSFPANNKPTVGLTAARSVNFIGGRDLSQPSSRPYAIEYSGNDSSANYINCSISRQPDQYEIEIESGYVTQKSRLSVDGKQVSKLAPNGWVSFNGLGTPTINEGIGVIGVSRVGTGHYAITTTKSSSFPNGFSILGGADDNAGGGGLYVSEVLGARSGNSFQIKVRDTSNVAIDTQFVAVAFFGGALS